MSKINNYQAKEYFENSINFECRSMYGRKDKYNKQFYWAINDNYLLENKEYVEMFIVYSYSKAIAIKVENMIFINNTYYSMTTRQHLFALGFSQPNIKNNKDSKVFICYGEKGMFKAIKENLLYNRLQSTLKVNNIDKKAVKI